MQRLLHSEQDTPDKAGYQQSEKTREGDGCQG